MKNRGILRRAEFLAGSAAGAYAFRRWPATSLGGALLLWVLFGKELRKNAADNSGAGDAGAPGVESPRA